MSVFNYKDYKQCINDWIDAQPSKGHGQLRKIAQYLGVNSVVMSQVFRGNRDLSLEQAVLVTNYIGMSDNERDYFLLLVQKERAGSHQLKDIFEKQIVVLRNAAQILKNRIKHEKFSDEERATFYSNWYYSAIRLGLSIPGIGSLTGVADYLGLERTLVSKVIQFLLKNKLIVEEKKGFRLGPQVTHVGHDSPFVTRHHLNWRLQGLKSMESHRSEDLFYTGPMVLSKEAAAEIRKLLIDVVEKSTSLAAPSDSEVLQCLSVDWFKVGKEQ